MSIRPSVLLPLFACIVLAACSGPIEGSGSELPSAPADVEATPVSGGVLVSWRDTSDNETGFKVYRQGVTVVGQQQTVVEACDVPADTTTCTDFGAASESTYSVAAQGAEGASEPVAAAETASPLPATAHVWGMTNTLDLVEGRLAAQFPAVTFDVRGYGSASAYLNDLESAMTSAPADVDVAMIDAVWVGALAGQLTELSIDDAAFFSPYIENSTAAGRLVSVPWFADVGLLYYRQDLLDAAGFTAPPATWAELETMAAAIQQTERDGGNSDFWGFVWQGNAYEGLSANALEWVASQGGGTVVEQDGTITVDNAEAIAAVEGAAAWIGSISPPDVTSFQEEDARSVWANGNAAFMRNWPYAYGLSVGAGMDFGVTAIPAADAGETGRGTAAGWGLGTGMGSDVPELSGAVVSFLTSSAEQEAVAVDAGLLPTRASLYTDPDVLAALPIAELVQDALEHAVPRFSTPTADQYSDASLLFYGAVHDVLLGNATAAAGLAQLERDLADLTGLPTASGPQGSSTIER